MSFSLSPEEDLANQVTKEFARLKKAGVEVSYPQLITWVISANGIKDPSEVARLRKRISEIRAPEMAIRQRHFRFRQQKAG